MLLNTVCRWLGEIISKGVWFVFIILLARKLGSAGFGYFNYAFSFGSLLVLFSDLGTNIFLVREIATDASKTSYYLSNIFLIKIVASIAVAVTAFFIPKSTPQVSLAVNIFTASLIISAFLDPLNSLFRANKDMLYETIVMLLWRLLIVSTSLAGIYFITNSLTLIAVAFIASSLLAVAVSVYIAGRAYNLMLFDIKLVDVKSWKALLRGASIIGVLIILGGMFFKFNTILLQYFCDAREVGLYSAAFKLIEGTFFISSIFIGSLFPYLCEANTGNKLSSSGIALFRKAFLLISLLAGSIAAVLFIFAEKIIRLCYGAEFAPSAASLKILSWSLIFIFLNELFMYLYLSIHRQKSVLKIMSLASVIYILLCLILIPYHGFTGASWVIMVSQAALFSFNLLLLRKVL